MRLKSLLLAVAGLAVLAVVAAAAATASGSWDHRGHHRHHHGRNGVCGLDVSWLKTSIEGDVFEIRGGQSALKKSSNPAVRALAQRLITDHTQSLHDALELARKYHIDAQVDPSPTEQWELEELAEMTGDVYDHDYAELEVLDHVQDIQETSDEARMGCNAEIRHDAAQEIPMLREHLDLSKKALATTKDD